MYENMKSYQPLLLSLRRQEEDGCQYVSTGGFILRLAPGAIPTMLLTSVARDHRMLSVLVAFSIPPLARVRFAPNRFSHKDRQPG